MLQAGATSVVCVDVGHGQLHPTLAGDSRVVSIEGLNARDMRPADLPRSAYGMIVIDVSFISLTLVLPAAWVLLAAGPAATLIALIKPQFEAGHEAVRKGKGII